MSDPPPPPSIEWFNELVSEHSQEVSLDQLIENGINYYFEYWLDVQDQWFNELAKEHEHDTVFENSKEAVPGSLCDSEEKDETPFPLHFLSMQKKSV